MLNNFYLTNIQIALFFAPGTNFKSIELAGGIADKLGDIFINEPNIISLPPNAPVEVPRIIFQQDNIGQLIISSLRADLIINYVGDEWVNRVISIADKLALYLNNMAKIRIQRIGLVLTMGIDEKLTVKDIQEKYIKQNKIVDCSELSIAWHKKTNIQGLNINRWVRINIADYIGGQRNLILDFNTFAEDIIDVQRFPVDYVIGEFIKDYMGDFNGIIEWN